MPARWFTVVVDVSPGTFPGVRDWFKILFGPPPSEATKADQLPLEGQHQHREHDRHGGGDDCDQDRVRADVDAAYAG
jgi:hypothetical protein